MDEILEGNSELTWQLVGRASITHESINSVLRLLSAEMRFCLSKWRTGKYDIADPVEKYQNTLSDLSLRTYFHFILIDWHEAQFRFLGKPEFYKDYPAILMDILDIEQKIRNQIIHSDITVRADKDATITATRTSRFIPRKREVGQEFSPKIIVKLKKHDLWSFDGFQQKIWQYLDCFQFADLEVYRDTADPFYRDPFYILENRQKFDQDIIKYAEEDQRIIKEYFGESFGKYFNRPNITGSTWHTEIDDDPENFVGSKMIAQQKEFIKNFHADVINLKKIRKIGKEIVAKFKN